MEYVDLKLQLNLVLDIFTEYFNLLDDDHDGKLQIVQASILFRALGQTISDASLNRKLSEFMEEIEHRKDEVIGNEIKTEGTSIQTKGILKKGKDRSDPSSRMELKRSPSRTLNRLKSTSSQEGEGMNLEQFINFFIEHYTHPTSEKLLVESFALFDENNLGFITVDMLTEILTRRGEALSSSEVNEILLLAGCRDKGAIDYVQLAERMVKGPQNVRSV